MRAEYLSNRQNTFSDFIAYTAVHKKADDPLNQRTSDKKHQHDFSLPPTLDAKAFLLFPAEPEAIALQEYREEKGTFRRMEKFLFEIITYVYYKRSTWQTLSDFVFFYSSGSPATPHLCPKPASQPSRTSRRCHRRCWVHCLHSAPLPRRS